MKSVTYRLKKQIIILLIILIGLAANLPCFSEEGLPYCCQKIIISGNAEYPPLTWQDRENKNKITGFAIELFKMALIGTGLKVDTICRQVATDTDRSKNRQCGCYMWCLYY
ncbi:MAG: hypothetical protein K8R67_13230 [Desulfobacteraceae bacterium]|nr:hypothetical protein [Desulfobacteraceae bacterium]